LVDGQTPEESIYNIIVRPEKSLESFSKGLEKFGWKVSKQSIPVDFLIWTNKDFPTVIERKTVADFIRSIKDGSLIDQLKAMRQLSDDSYILLEGSWAWTFSLKNKYRSHFNERSLVGFIDAVDKFGVRIIPVNNQMWSMWWIDKRLRDITGKVKRMPIKLRPSASPDLTPAKQAEYIVGGFPYLGPSGVEEIKTKFSTLKSFIDWITHETPSYLMLSTRIKNLRDKWKGILEEKWNE